MNLFTPIYIIEKRAGTAAMNHTQMAVTIEHVKPYAFFFCGAIPQICPTPHRCRGF
jgi:hypothetical protein